MIRRRLKNTIRKKLFLPLVSIVTLIGLSETATAHCPLCTAAAGTGIGFAKYFGIDLLIFGLWLGFLMLSMSLWWMKSNYIPLSREKNHHQLIIVVIVSLGFLIPFYFAGLLQSKHVVVIFNRIFIFNRLLLGTILGIAIAWGTYKISRILKERNNGEVYIPFQSIILTTLVLIVLSLLIHF